MKLTCKIHGIELVCYCPACRGEATSKRKAAASRENGKKGGRPRKTTSANSSKAQKKTRGAK